ncbi:coenzyme F420 biosynthesis-associated protein [Streptomyces sp. 3MP-14]|uniref:Coenzyme F420 biosynthesis-associated protein n=1 Tax=Streptomyces mimosae TaxID=2586635 RepID=A0A5N6A7B8_9ACTN|nr:MULTISPECIES: zinc-dependent metalloprotease [Streptomyces]KAB8163839.1 coenzyme F420 biosynthesis-associated protein [Streptomyces mimosae]KAB8175282.1 coenzyme F420 biosynthesis-associated protein [Streptomyces sp. 3MP-14]
MTSLGGTDLVDWNLAVSTATRFARQGPEVSRDEARAVVAELRAHATAAEGHVRAYTRLDSGPLDTPVLVVDRPGWIKANVAGFREVLQPLMARMRERRSASPAGGMLTAVGGKVTGVEVGMLLSFLSSRVLGQYETFAPATTGLPAGGPGARAGRLLLVAPNIVQVERELDVRPHDFRLWVCLHEETHRTQFTAVPWLRDHLESEIQAFLAEADVDPATLVERVRQAFGALTGRNGQDAARETVPEEPVVAPAEENGGLGIVDLVQTPRQREILERLTAVMSLLEGHADHVMDAVGPDVVPSVGEIREKFTRRRETGAGRLDRALRRLLGLDAKLRQYKDGERFVRTVVERTGMDGFNKVWTSPNTLPTKDEIADPERWLARVHGHRDLPGDGAA